MGSRSNLLAARRLGARPLTGRARAAWPRTTGRPERPTAPAAARSVAGAARPARVRRLRLAAPTARCGRDGRIAGSAGPPAPSGRRRPSPGLPRSTHESQRRPVILQDRLTIVRQIRRRARGATSAWKGCAARARRRTVCARGVRPWPRVAGAVRLWCPRPVAPHALRCRRRRLQRPGGRRYLAIPGVVRLPPRPFWQVFPRGERVPADWWRCRQWWAARTGCIRSAGSLAGGPCVSPHLLRISCRKYEFRPVAVPAGSPASRGGAAAGAAAGAGAGGGGPARWLCSRMGAVSATRTTSRARDRRANWHPHSRAGEGVRGQGAGGAPAASRSCIGAGWPAWRRGWRAAAPRSRAASTASRGKSEGRERTRVRARVRARARVRLRGGRRRAASGASGHLHPVF